MDKQEINNAISEHAMWKLNLQSLIQRGKLGIPSNEAKDTECEFGKWFYGPSITPRQRSSAQYKRVKQLHIVFHEVAAKVASCVAKGEKEEVERLMGFEGEFTAISNELMEELNRWKDSLR